MPQAVSDARSNPNDQIAHAANVLKKSAARRTVFEAICKGGKKPKTVKQLMLATGFSQVKVLQHGGKLADQQLVHKTKKETAYEKDRFYATNRDKVLRFAKYPEKLKALPTKYAPKTSAAALVNVSVIGVRIDIKELTVDDFDQFYKVRTLGESPAASISENAFKLGVQKLIGETGKFVDWGGEPNDLYTSKLKHHGQRRAIAFAFKGPGTSGVLTPKKLGKNGNQIQRLFLSPAEVFVVQYHAQISQDVVEQMKAFATMNSVKEGRRIWYGVIDGDDTNRLLAAYPKQFGLS